MAKQYGIHKIAGKIDEQVYYYSKNGGYISRKQNPGMSERVKTSKEFANTRLNNKEFGAAGSLAGAIVSPISIRWRYILDSIATGKLVKAIKAAMLQDTANTWGKRVVPLAEMAGIQAAFNRFSKNEIPQEVVTALQNQMTYNSSTHVLNIEDSSYMSSDTAQQLKDKGANYFSTKVFAFNVSKPVIGADGVTYEKPEVLLIDLSSTFGQSHILVNETVDILVSDSISNSPAVLNEESHLGGLLVVFLPERKVGDDYFTLQELCSAYWCPAKLTTNP